MTGFDTGCRFDNVCPPRRTLRTGDSHSACPFHAASAVVIIA